MTKLPFYDVAVVGGGPAGATAATDLARKGLSVALIDRGGRIKPCGGAIPPRAIADFDIPEHLLVARATAARMVAPSGNHVDMPVGNGFVGLVDRGPFDEWLRARAALAGATRITGGFEGIERDGEAAPIVTWRAARGGAVERLRARIVIGADGARSGVARAVLKGGGRTKQVFAYHEIVRAPEAESDAYRASRCDVVYRGDLSPDFYSWIFPHGDSASIGVGSAIKGFALRPAVERLRAEAGLADCATLRREGAPIPLRPLRRWDNGRDVVVAGDAAGVVAPASGEGIYYAMACGRMAAEAAARAIATGDARALRGARRAFMREHGRVFLALGLLQYVWYSSDKRREAFVRMCADPDVQALTWQAYMEKRLVRRRPMAHARVVWKDLKQLFGMGATT